MTELFNAEYCFQPVFGRVGFFAWAWNPLAKVVVVLGDDGIRIARAKPFPIPIRFLFPIGLVKLTWNCAYNEIVLAQPVAIPGWLAQTQRNRSLTKRVRLDMGDSRARPVLILSEIDELLAELERHGVTTELAAKKMNKLWIGRR